MEKVTEILKELETKHEINIIYAVEAGSRAWGLESDDSDYDMRFVFIYKNPKKYISLKPLKETIDGFSEDRLYDWQGWDITKALRLLHQMNPGMAEWLFSPIIYYQDKSKFDFQENARKLLLGQKRITPLLHHYRSMAKANYKTHIQNEKNVKIKKYLYVIRPAGMFEWLLKCRKQENNDLIEIDFNKVLVDLKEHLNQECFESILNVIEIKRQSNEMDLKPRIECIDKWIENILNNTNDQIKALEAEQPVEKAELDEYDDLLHSILNIKF